MKRCIKIVFIILILLSVFLGNNCYAAPNKALQESDGGGTSAETLPELDDPTQNPDAYKPSDKGNNTKLKDFGNIIVGAIRTIGTVIAVVALMVIGIRYMFGSAAEKANYKETMVPYLIGAIMLFTIPNLLGIIYDLVKGINF